MATAAKHGLFHHPFFAHLVRVRLADRLAGEMGYDRASAMEAASGVTDDVINEAATHVRAAEPKAGAGGIIAAILAFLQSPAFGQLLQLLLGLFSAQSASPTPVGSSGGDGSEPTP